VCFALRGELIVKSVSGRRPVRMEECRDAYVEGDDGMSRSRRSQVGANLDASRLRALGGGSRNGLLLFKLLFEGVASR
jgi:hypothetical protein